MDLRLNSSDQYKKDLRKIVNEIRANGSIPKLLGINIVCPGGYYLELFICAQFQQNMRVNGSLYILGFRNSNGTFSFNIPNLYHLWGRKFTTLESIDGSYRSLNCADAVPWITLDNLISGIQNLSTYEEGTSFTRDLKKSLARLIVITSEAFRSNEIAQGVADRLGMLNTREPYRANWNTIHNWGGGLLNSM